MADWEQIKKEKFLKAWPMYLDGTIPLEAMLEGFDCCKGTLDTRAKQYGLSLKLKRDSFNPAPFEALGIEL